MTLIDKSDAFLFGFSKLDVMFGRAPLEAVRLPYETFAKPGVRLKRETITAIDPAARRVTTDAGVHECDYLVIALGADYDMAATPPSPDTSTALIAAFAERDIRFMPNRRVTSVDATRKVATLDDGGELSYELFLGVPKHRAPAVVMDSGMAEDGWIPVNPRTLETKYANVYAIGDVANTGTPKAGVFAEAAAQAVASSLCAHSR